MSGLSLETCTSNLKFVALTNIKLNLYRKLQKRALRPKGDDIQPRKIACLAKNLTVSHSLNYIRT